MSILASAPRRERLAEDSPDKERRLPKRTPLEKSVTRQGEQAGLVYAYKLLGYRGRSEKEIMRRLRIKGFEEPVIEKVIIRLKSSGLLDDRKLAFSLTRYAEESRTLSVAGTRKLLMERGIPRDLIHDALADMDETETARRLVEKRLTAWERRGLGSQPFHLTPEITRKLYGILYRNGYPSEIIKRTLKQFICKEDME
ncbi:MAG TPA: regulatory protein RecX [Thermodesulfovibrionales bacterium]|nr:regulatory protein RecX [Thermodesulfovibrionales bacterium]